jgi:hypothetical protein
MNNISQEIRTVGHELNPGSPYGKQKRQRLDCDVSVILNTIYVLSS